MKRKKNKTKTKHKVTADARTMHPNPSFVKHGRCDNELQKTLVKNPSDVLAATPDRNQVPLLEGFGPGLLAKDKRDTRAHAEVFVSMYTLFAEGRLHS